MTAPQFRAALKRLGFSQRRLALRLKLDPKTTNRWARGKSPIPEAVAQLLTAWLAAPPKHK
jgi:transcriptional regulator with XRE-family HTH domain